MLNGRRLAGSPLDIGSLGATNAFQSASGGFYRPNSEARAYFFTQPEEIQALAVLGTIEASDMVHDPVVETQWTDIQSIYLRSEAMLRA